MNGKIGNGTALLKPNTEDSADLITTRDEIEGLATQIEELQQLKLSLVQARNVSSDLKIINLTIWYLGST